ncbi:TetR family transcriptional regulator [Prauserella shujinwangii]|uniref:TetR family transcriptional regulator n=1 Tax=Prauserella shujinwangii TaxID=1453103 RepID=A0A2T0LNY7_9PSEU|nr:TetR/AcrR family transcriptional regulator [Prauserella shujinwangii]PRX44924.1 TetR family transcriptional regulator [Prauserella shujinwangii]
MSMRDQAPRRRMEPDARRAEILGVARRLFGARSYSTVSTSDIAAEAGVARALLNHYFGSKRQVHLDVVERNRDMWLSAIGLEAFGHDPKIDQIMLKAASREWLVRTVLHLVNAVFPAVRSDENSPRSGATS